MVYLELVILSSAHSSFAFRLPSYSKAFFADSLILNNETEFAYWQVASQETYGTLGAIVRSQTGSRQVGFLTNRHVAVDLDYPSQKMFHPLPPNLGPGVYLGAVERATSFITDDLWYGIFAGINPGNLTPSCKYYILRVAFLLHWFI